MNVILGDVPDFTLKHLFHQFFFMWGFWCVFTFWMYERARKYNEKMQKEMKDKIK
jgi:preprotein translocase subunit YajC